VVAHVTATVFGLALGANTIALPLVTIDAGYSAAEIGYLAALSAGVQILVRLTLTAIMRRYPDRVLVTGAGAVLALSFGAVALSTELGPLVLAYGLQGASRACFWTGAQVHVVHGDGPVQKNLARITLCADAGMFVGPVTAGLIYERSPDLSLQLGLAIAVLAVLLSLGMRRFAPFRWPEMPSGTTSLWRRRPVLSAAIATAVAGSWRSLLSSYVPVALAQGGQAAGAIGVFVSVASAANTASVAVLARVSLKRKSLAMVTGCLAAAVGLGLAGLAAGSSPAVAVCLAVSGLGAGVLQILGSSLAAESVHPQERGAAIALTGTVRAGTMMVSPLVVAGLVQVVSVAAALAVAGALISASSVALRKPRR
jgi:MFS family permease